MKLISVGIVLGLLFRENYGFLVEPSLKSLKNAAEVDLFDDLMKKMANKYIKDLQPNEERDVKNFLMQLFNVANDVKKFLLKASKVERDYKGKIVHALILGDYQGSEKIVVEMTQKMIVTFNNEIIKYIVGDDYDGDNRISNELIKLSWKEGADFEEYMEAMKKPAKIAIRMLFQWAINAVKGAMNDMVDSFLDQGAENVRVRITIGKSLINKMRNTPSFMKMVFSKPFALKELKRYEYALKIHGLNRFTEIERGHKYMLDIILKGNEFIQDLHAKQ